MSVCGGRMCGRTCFQYNVLFVYRVMEVLRPANFLVLLVSPVMIILAALLKQVTI